MWVDTVRDTSSWLWAGAKEGRESGDLFEFFLRGGIKKNGRKRTASPLKPLFPHKYVIPDQLYPLYLACLRV